MRGEEFTMYNRNKVENDESYLKKLCTYWEGTGRGYINRHVGACIGEWSVHRKMISLP